MINDFSRTLSLLRREKRISQRSAAEALGVSQALLSHYENGVREPGLEFVVNAANYYKVSLDYLLGRTMHRDGMMIYEGDIEDISREKSSTLTGSVSAVLSKKLLINSVAILFEVLGKSENKRIVRSVTQYLDTAFVKMFRYVARKDKKLLPDAYPVSDLYFSELCDVKMKKCEAELCAESEKGDESLDLSPEAIQKEYPSMSPALFSVIHTVSDSLKNEIQ